MSPKIKIEEHELVALLKAHDQRGIRILYDNYSAALFGVISRIITEQETAEDVLQETFIKIWNNIGNYDASKGRLFTWLLNLARNLAIDKTRSKDFKSSGKVRSIEDFVHNIDRTSNTSLAVDHIGLNKVLDELIPEHRVLIDLLYFGGYTQAEAAKTLDIPLGTVKTRVKIAMTQLREILGVKI
ncbi:MAG: RNA polymerase, sigma-24 subunit, ECF subfamily [Bacteroidetes bacterium]|nr:MAG: RNA polymerase, sigma-24 subunit, ECF subfamily [Bacteroidota bacterium]